MLNGPLSKLKPALTGEVVLDTKETAKAIAACRVALGIQQKVLASEMNISQPYLGDLERGARHWNMDLFEKAKAAMERITAK